MNLDLQNMLNMKLENCIIRIIYSGVYTRLSTYSVAESDKNYNISTYIASFKRLPTATEKTKKDTKTHVVQITQDDVTTLAGLLLSYIQSAAIDAVECLVDLDFDRLYTDVYQNTPPEVFDKFVLDHKSHMLNELSQRSDMEKKVISKNKIEKYVVLLYAIGWFSGRIIMANSIIKARNRLKFKMLLASELANILESYCENADILKNKILSTIKILAPPQEEKPKKPKEVKPIKVLAEIQDEDHETLSDMEEKPVKKPVKKTVKKKIIVPVEEEEEEEEEEVPVKKPMKKKVIAPVEEDEEEEVPVKKAPPKKKVQKKIIEQDDEPVLKPKKTVKTVKKIEEISEIPEEQVMLTQDSASEDSEFTFED